MSIKVFNTDFYPRSPCGERPRATCGPAGGRTFLSTLSLRRATLYSSSSSTPAMHFYPRSPCGERLCAFVSLFGVFLFLSTLSLRRATAIRVKNHEHARFLSTLSLRRATKVTFVKLNNCYYFYPRSPCGERHGFLRGLPKEHLFLSTLSLRRATFEKFEGILVTKISIHALLAESDVSCMLYDTSSLIFLSTLSLRRATCECWTAPNRL